MDIEYVEQDILDDVLDKNYNVRGATYVVTILERKL